MNMVESAKGAGARPPITAETLGSLGPQIVTSTELGTAIAMSTTPAVAATVAGLGNKMTPVGDSIKIDDDMVGGNVLALMIDRESKKGPSRSSEEIAYNTPRPTGRNNGPSFSV